jgi:hypothetical protein
MILDLIKIKNMKKITFLLTCCLILNTVLISQGKDYGISPPPPPQDTINTKKHFALLIDKINLIAKQETDSIVKKTKQDRIKEIKKYNNNIDVSKFSNHYIEVYYDFLYDTVLIEKKIEFLRNYKYSQFYGLKTDQYIKKELRPEYKELVDKYSSLLESFLKGTQKEKFIISQKDWKKYSSSQDDFHNSFTMEEYFYVKIVSEYYDNIYNIYKKRLIYIMDIIMALYENQIK